MLERENRELDERLAELYLEWITKTRGLATPAQNLTTAVITAKSLTRLPQGPNHEGGSDCSQPSLGMADYLLPNLEWFSSWNFTERSTCI